MQLRLLAELAPLLAGVLIAWWFPSFCRRVCTLPSRVLGKLAATPRRAIVWSALLSFAVCPIFSWVRPPSPQVHDEFSYLLAADTFASGRLTNPPHPLWAHFESFHINQQPTYQSKYPPGQGLFLAAGQALTGRPIVGVWLSVAAGAAAVCWMLLGWMPPRWALFGGLLPALRFGALPLWDDFWFAYWNTSFWGGAVAMTGGALLFGALPRLMRGPRAQDAAWLGAGLLVLANTRPFEGLIAAAAAAVVLAGWAGTQLSRWKVLAARILTGAGAVLAVGFLAMGYYNYRGTGDVGEMPYIANSEQYEVVPLFIFQPAMAGKTYNHEVFREYHYEFMKDGYDRKRSGFGVPTVNLILATHFFWGYVLWVALLFVPARLTRWTAFAVAMSVLAVLANAVSSSERLHLHYLAPFVPWFVFLAVTGLRQMRVMRLGRRRIGRGMAEAAAAVCLLTFSAACMLRAHYGHPYPSAVRDERPLISSRLQVSAGKDLVIVTYGPSHNMLEEWVYNDADLEGAEVIWARDMGAERNRELVEYYAERHIWRLYADEAPPRLEPYD
jgi:hypothetical protein